MLCLALLSQDLVQNSVCTTVFIAFLIVWPNNPAEAAYSRGMCFWFVVLEVSGVHSGGGDWGGGWGGGGKHGWAGLCLWRWDSQVLGEPGERFGEKADY